LKLVGAVLTNFTGLTTGQNLVKLGHRRLKSGQTTLRPNSPYLTGV
jgi:hypothetical protein